MRLEVLDKDKVIERMRKNGAKQKPYIAIVKNNGCDCLVIATMGKVNVFFKNLGGMPFIGSMECYYREFGFSTELNNALQRFINANNLCRARKISVIEDLERVFVYCEPVNMPEVQIKDLRTALRSEDKETELGVELELEHEYEDAWDTYERRLADHPLVHDVGEDSSVAPGIEIRFEHPTFDKWRAAGIDSYLRLCESCDFGTDRGEAGMHIHVSGKGQAIAAHTLRTQFDVFKAIVYPINDRIPRPSGCMEWGRGGNTAYPKAEQGTIEIRAWRATTNPEVFMRRVQFTKDIFEYMASGRMLKNFFKCCSEAARANYIRLIELCEFHNYGAQPHVAIAWATNKTTVPGIKKED